MSNALPKSLSLAAAAARMNWAGLPFLVRYAGAILIIAAATGLRMVLPLDSAPFLLYMPCVFVSGFLFGKGPGVFATLLSSIIAIFFFMSPASDAELSWEELLGTLLYVVISVVLVIICDMLAQALRRRDSEIQETRAAKTALESNESFLRSVLASSPDCINVLDIEGHLSFMNEGGQKVMEVKDFDEIKGYKWLDFWHGEHHDAAKKALMQAQAGEAVRFQGLCQTIAGTPKWWDVSVSPIVHSADRIDRILVTSRDITEQKRVEAQQKLLNHELGHRLKNMLAMIQAVANQTLRRASSLAEAGIAFDSRLIALGKAQDVLTGTHWESAEITAVIRNALAPHGVETDRFVLQGPAVMLSSRCSLAFSLALHELATNATKYGALSTEAGTITISWRIHEAENGLRFTLEWCESGGPPVVKPERSGFGSFMIERSLSAYFKGSARIEYAAGGVVFTLDAPTTWVESEFQAGNVDILALKANIN